MVIFAAASLSSAFDSLAGAYESSGSGMSLEINYGASRSLRVQIREGAYADVFASADSTEMEQAAADGLVHLGDEILFARNRLALILAPGNPAGLALPGDLARPGVRVAIADEAVPLGRYSRILLERLGQESGIGLDFSQRVLSNVVSFELSASAVMGRLRSGEADVAIGYASDLSGIGAGLSALAMPSAVSPEAEYLAAPVIGSDRPEAARAFTVWLLGPEAQAILADSGFLPASVP